MNTSLPPLRALRRQLQYLWCGALLLASAATARAQAPSQVPFIYGLGTATQAVPSGNLFFPAGASIGDQGLVAFFTTPNGAGGANPSARPVKIINVTAGQKLVGIDSRPLTGEMYALGYDPSRTAGNAQVYTLNVATGVVTAVGNAISLNLGPTSNDISFDFNPIEDQIRVLSTNRNNYRLSPTDGSLVATDTPLAYVGGTPASPGVVTAAYSNSTIGSTSTTLYDLDKANGNILTIQDLPSSGMLTRTTPRLLFDGIDPLTNSLALGLDIANNSTMGYLIQATVANTNGLSSTNLFDVDLQTGLVTNKRNLIPSFQSSGFNVFDIAVPIVAPVCDAPTNPAAGGVTSNGATISFTPNAAATDYTVTVTPAGGTAATQPATGSPVTLTGLTPNTSYTVSIASNCFSGLLSSSAVSTTFTTPVPTCAAPSGLTASNVTDNSGTVTFAGNGSATSYTVTTSPVTTTQTLPANATSVDFTGLAPSTTYTVSIVNNCAGGATAGPATLDFTTAALTRNLTWTGFVSDEWTNPLNWQPNRVPTSADDVFIPGTYTPGSPLSTSTFPGTTPTPNQPVVRVTGQAAGALVINTAASLTIAANGTLAVNSDFTNNGNGITSNSTGRVLLAGAAQQTVGGSALTTFPNLTVGPAGASTTGPVAILPTAGLTLNGNLAIGAGQAFTLRSDATGTAYVVNNNGAFASGSATVQRYIAPNLNAGPGYRHYSSPVDGNTVADFTTTGYTPVVNPAYNTSATPPLVTPFPNIYTYNQARLGLANTSPEFDKGFQSPASLGDAIAPALGYSVNIDASALVDFTGVLNTSSISRTGLTRGPQATAGWQFLGNPYPSAINYDVVRANSAGLESALYVFKSSGQYSGSYTSYVNGQSTNTGTNVLPVAQAFFVRVAAGQTGAVNFTDASRFTTADNTPFQRTTADPRPRLALALGNASLRTQTVVYFEAGATAAFDPGFDAHYLPATNGLTLATETPAGEALSISGQPALAGAEVLLPLQLAVAAAGTYTLQTDDLANLPTGYHAYLRDALTGTYTDLATTPTTNLTLAPNAAAGGRYAVLFTKQAHGVVAAPAALAMLASVYPNPARTAATLLLPMALRGSQATAVSVADNLGRVVLTRTLAADAAETLELPLGGLAPGVYSVQARTAAGLVVKRLVVE